MCFDMAEAVRFELTEPFDSLVFKTSAINRTRPHFHLAGASGLEPEITESKSVVLPLHYAPTKQLKFLKNKKP
jgi:hypothetical protein